MQIPKPTRARVLVFTVPVRRKIEGSLLYKPAPRRNSYIGSQECWIVSIGPEVREKLEIGAKAFVHDGFEFEEIKQDYLWDTLQNDERFKSLKAYVDLVEGDVVVNVVPESALLAVEFNQITV
jgi:hypothetical protein